MDTIELEESGPKTPKPRIFNTTKLSNTAKEVVRWGVPPRAAAAIANAVLADFKIISKENTTATIDRNKLRRAIEKYEKELLKEREIEMEECPPEMLSFDGKKDVTLVRETDETGKQKIIIGSEEHVTVISEPGSEYLAHLTPGHKGVDIANGLYEFMSEKNILKSVKIIGADSTAVNTGWISGAIALLEKKKQEKLLWLICLLHLNELPLRHVFQAVDGKTDSKNTFKGKKKCILFHSN